MTSLDLLRLAYVMNIAILVPVCSSLFLSRSGDRVAAFEQKCEDSPCLRLLVGSLWSGVLLCSVAGLVYPKFFCRF